MHCSYAKAGPKPRKMPDMLLYFSIEAISFS